MIFKEILALPFSYFLYFYFLWIFFWIIRTFKSLCFWLYLWQLKEYHWRRFKAHFQTYKGKKIFLNPLFFLKVLLLLLAITQNLWILSYLALFVIYCFEATSFFSKSFLRPVWTIKSTFLLIISALIIFLFSITVVNFSLSNQVMFFLLFDIFSFFIFSFIILSFQPFVFLVRKYYLKKAEKKIKKIKAEKNLKVIAITGSYGKTSTKEFLATILSSKNKVLFTKVHQNSEIAIAKTILKELDSSYQYFIAEIGAYDKGKVREVCKMIKPDIGIVTGVNEQHLALFGSMKNLLSAEGGRELSASLSDGGLLVVNGENKYCLDLLKTNTLPSFQERIYALSNKIVDSDIWAEEIEVTKDKLYFVVINKKREIVPFEVKLLGKHNIENLLGATLVANELGMSLEEISQACKEIIPEQGGIVVKEGKYGIQIIDSSYSSNPDGVIADLDYLNLFPQKKVIVMPCLIELGKKAPKIHKRIGEKISQVCDFAILTTKDYFKDVREGMKNQGKEDKIFFIEDSKEIFSKITTICSKGDAVLLEGRIPRALIDLLINE